MKENLISDKSLIYQWTFNDNMSVVDNYRVKATVFGNPTYNNGIVTFNGSTDYYKLKTLINLGTKYSIEVKAKSAFTANGDYIVGGYSVGGLSLIDIFKTSNTIVHCGKSFGTNTFPTDQQWHIYTITRNGNVAISLYIDGVFIISVNMSSNINMLVKAIGALDDGNYKWNGQLEYIKIWNRQLSPSEVKNNYNGKTYKSLPYVSTEILATVVNNPDLTTWSLNQAANGSRTSNSVTYSTGNYGVWKEVLITGRRYKYTIIGTQTSGTLTLNNLGFTNPNGFYMSFNADTVINITGYFTAYDSTILLYKLSSGTFTYTTFKIEEVTQSTKNTIFHINSDNGVIRDLTRKTTPVNTNMTLKPLGSNIRVVNGNGTNSNLALGSNLITGDLTFLTVLNTTSLGEGSSNQYGMIFSNSKLQIWINDSTNRIGISRDGGITKVYSNNNVIKFGDTVFLMITTTATGITNVYSCSKNSNLVLASTSNLSAGNLVDTAHLTYIGDDGTGNRTFKGWIDDTMIIQGILTLEEGSQYVSSIKYKYQ